MESEKPSDKLAGAAKTVVEESLSSVSDTVNTAIESTTDTVHELRDDAMRTIHQTVGRVKASLDQQRPRVERYISSHPWIVLGGLVILWYLLSGKPVPTPNNR